MQENPYTSPRETSEIQRRRFGLVNVMFVGLGVVMLLPLFGVIYSLIEGMTYSAGEVLLFTLTTTLGVALIFHGVKRSIVTLAVVGPALAAVALLIVGLMLRWWGPL